MFLFPDVLTIKRDTRTLRQFSKPKVTVERDETASINLYILHGEEKTLRFQLTENIANLFFQKQKITLDLHRGKAAAGNCRIIMETHSAESLVPFGQVLHDIRLNAKSFKDFPLHETTGDEGMGRGSMILDSFSSAVNQRVPDRRLSASNINENRKYMVERMRSKRDSLDGHGKEDLVKRHRRSSSKFSSQFSFKPIDTLSRQREIKPEKPLGLQVSTTLSNLSDIDLDSDSDDFQDDPTDLRAMLKSNQFSLKRKGYIPPAIVSSSPLQPATRTPLNSRDDFATFHQHRNKLATQASRPYLTSVVPATNQRKTTVEGFANLGNTCYMNVVLQALLNIPEFISRLHQVLKNRTINDALSKKQPTLSQTFLKIMEAKKETKVVQPRELQNIMAGLGQKFQLNRQEDADEFLREFLDQIEVETCQLMKSGNENVNPNSANSDAPSKCIDVISEHFGFSIEHNLQCLKCGKISPNRESYRDISLFLPNMEELKEIGSSQAVSIQLLIDRFFADIEVMYHCEQTDCTCETAMVKNRIYKLPQTLIIQLKRFNYETDETNSGPGSLIKRKDVVALNEYLHLAKWRADECKTSSAASATAQGSSTVNPNENQNPIITNSSSSIKDAPKDVVEIDLTQSSDDELIPFPPLATAAATPKTTSTTENPIDLTDIPYEQQLTMAIQNSLCEDEASLYTVPSPEKPQDQVMDQEMTPGFSYRLQTVISHIGPSLGSGHYVCDVLSEKDNIWKSFSDDRLTEIGSFKIMERLRNQNAYLLFYTKQ